MLSRRDFVALGSATALSNAVGATPARKPSDRPNLIIFLADDLGCHDLGCLGAGDLKTPHIDALGTSGARFTNWYANAPVCAPSRGALMTGRYPQRNGVSGNGRPLRPSELTIAALLKSRGYATGAFGKWHLGATPDTVPNAHGFDRFVGFHAGCFDYYSHRFYWGDPRIVNYHDLWRDRTEIFENGQYSTEIFAREAKNFILENRSRPFFVYLPFNGVHYPMHAPKKYVERFPTLGRERQMYAAMLSAVDDGVGEVMGTLRKLGLLENTLVFFGADNGATRERRAGLDQKPATAGNNDPFRGFKFSLFDGGMHVPGILTWPGVIPGGQVIHEMGAHIDLLPTFCKAGGVSLPTDRTFDGRDALPMATSKGTSPHEALYWSSGGQLAVRQGNWKLVKDGFLADGTENNRKRLSGDDAIFLSDVGKDPGESHNLRHQQPEVTDQLLTKAQHWLEHVTEM